jgi:hypothetical protein
MEENLDEVLVPFIQVDLLFLVTLDVRPGDEDDGDDEDGEEDVGDNDCEDAVEETAWARFCVAVLGMSTQNDDLINP